MNQPSRSVRAWKSASQASQALARHDWLSLLQTSGPWLTLPVVNRAFPDGMPALATAQRAEVRVLVADMLETQGASRHRLIGAVLRDVFDWDEHLREGASLPATLAETVPDRREVVRPDFAFYAEQRPDGASPTTTPTTSTNTDTDTDPSTDTATTTDTDTDPSTEPATGPAAGPWRMLGLIGPWGTHPLARETSGGWTASPVERLAMLLRARDVPVGITTDGRWWAVVWAPRGGTTAAGVWDAASWSEEPDMLAALAALLGRRQFLNVPPADELASLFHESREPQEEITEALGGQVRDAVELLAGALDQLDAQSGRTLLAAVSDDDVYDGVVTFMMRLVFLLFAEERRLLPSDDATYDEAYSVSRLVTQLEEKEALFGPQVLRHRTGAWHRLLAISRAVHHGVAHEDLRLPPYGGSLFDPDRYPWLEGRSSLDPDPTASPPAIDDATVLAMLRAVQYVEISGERRRLTFRALDVEQIGYVYEGLLEYEVRTATEPVLCLVRPTDRRRQKAPSEVPYTELLTATAAHTDRKARAAWLRDRTGLSAKQAVAALDHVPAPDQQASLERLVGIGPGVAEQIGWMTAVLRTDAEGRPLVVPVGGRYVTRSTRRAAAGAHYTPRALAEEVVDHTLEPLVFRPGPLETAERSAWRLRPASTLLGLRVADIAMGSGAFLVAACRYLADRLVEAWEAEGRTDAGRFLGRRRDAAVETDAEADPVLLDARRLVAEHCLYGVDVNPLAVEMAKLSLWLVTMDRERPFGFLDDRLLAGDSLLGVTSIQQLDALHLDPAAGRRRTEGSFDQLWNPVRRILGEAADLRRQITDQPVTTIRDVEHKQRLLLRATRHVDALGVIADAVTGTGLVAATRSTKDQQALFVALGDRVRAADQAGTADDLAARAATDLQDGRPPDTSPRVCLHWPLAFPEVFADAAVPGFDAIVGNPPFLGGKKISGALGDDYRAWLQRWDGRGVRGSADLVAFFLLRAEWLLSDRGQLGYIAVNTVTEGETLGVGLLPATERGLVLRRARSSHPWPSKSANLQIVEVWGSRSPLGPDARCQLDGEEVRRIGPDLQPVGRVSGRPEQLQENDGCAFIGSYVLGLGFTMSPEKAAELIRRDPHNAEVLQPYVIGKDLNQRPDCSASRWIINFREWPLERCQQYPELLEIVERRVHPERLTKDDAKYPRMVNEWWKFWQYRQGLEGAIADLDHVLALSRVGNVLLPVRVPTGVCFSEVTVVFALDGFADLALLSSGVHAAWAIRYTSTMRTDIRYAPTDVFLTLPRPATTPLLTELGQRLDTDRRVLMLGRAWGLTTTYNHVHDPTDQDAAVVGLRDVHRAIDEATFSAYGWDDLDPRVGHYPTKIGVRWTLSPEVRAEVLDRLLEENHRRHAAATGHALPSHPAPSVSGQRLEEGVG